MRFARTILCLALSIGLLMNCSCSTSDPPIPADGSNSRRNGPPAVGFEPPELVAAEWLNADGPQTLAELRGNVVLVEFWATWCPPCVSGIPHLNELQEKYADQGLRILSFTQENRATVEQFQRSRKVPIHYTVGIGSPLSRTYGVRSIPHAFVVGRDGKLVWRGHPGECEQMIIAALGRKDR